MAMQCEKLRLGMCHGGLQKVNLGLPWRPQDAGDARVIGYLFREAANREWNKSKREKYVVVNKAKRS